MNRAPKQRGASLIELIAAVAVLIILAGIILPGAFKLMEMRERSLTRDRLEELDSALVAFYRDHGRFPTSGEGLDALVGDPGSGRWNGPYLKAAESGYEALEDAGGQTITYDLSSGRVTISSPTYTDLTHTLGAGRVESEWVERAEEELMVLSSMAEYYRTSSGTYPASVAAMLGNSVGKDLATDPWGQAYQIDGSQQVPWSLGPDQTASTADDIYPVGYDPTTIPAPQPPPSGDDDSDSGSDDDSGDSGSDDGSGDSGSDDGSSDSGSDDGSSDSGSDDGSGDSGSDDGSGDTGSDDGSGDSGSDDGSGDSGSDDDSSDSGSDDGSGDSGSDDGSGDSGSDDDSSDDQSQS